MCTVKSTNAVDSFAEPLFSQKVSTLDTLKCHKCTKIGAKHCRTSNFLHLFSCSNDTMLVSFIAFHVGVSFSAIFCSIFIICYCIAGTMNSYRKHVKFIWYQTKLWFTCLFLCTIVKKCNVHLKMAMAILPYISNIMLAIGHIFICLNYV